MINFIGKLDNSFKYHKHKHNLYEIIYFVKGEGKTVFEEINKEIPFQKGSILIIPPNIIHEDISKIGYSNIHFTCNTFCIRLETPMKIEDNNGAFILEIINQAYEVYHKKNKNYENILINLLETFYSYFFSFYDDKNENREVELMKNIIIQNFSNCYFNLNDIYKKVNFNQEYARRLFVKSENLTPSQYLLQIRMEYAKKLLSFSNQTSFSIKEVAHLSGYDDQLYFSRLFKKYFSASPLNYKSNKNPKL